MMNKFLMSGLALFAAAACTTSGQTINETKANAAMQEVVDQNPDMTADEANTAREFVMREEDGSRVICKRKQVTGSKFNKKICLTWDQWREIEERSQQYAKELDQRDRQTNVPRSN